LEDRFAADDGVVLHQPLNLQIFRKNGDFGRKMNGPPVCLGRNLQNAPTWRPGNPFFGTPFWGYFLLILSPLSIPICSAIQHTQQQSQHPNPIRPHLNSYTYPSPILYTTQPHTHLRAYSYTPILSTSIHTYN